jgi:integrase
LHEELQPAPGDAVSPIKDAKTTLRKACKRLGLPPFTHHDFRHMFATTCIEAGVDIIGPECAIPLQTPIRNLQAIVEAAKAGY